MGSSQSNETARLWDASLQKEISTYAEFEDDWFEQGASRYAYKGLYHEGSLGGSKCCVKLYKSGYISSIGDKAWDTDARASMKSKQLADSFNRDVKCSKPVNFLIPWLAKVHESSNFTWLWLFPEYKEVRGNSVQTKMKANEMIPKGATLAIEDFLQGTYEKYLNNGGWINTDLTTQIPHAFAHYSYHISDDITNGALLVCDLQGIRKNDSYLLTDPAIHHANNGPNFYGPTDLGKAGILMFFESHVCNSLCNRFKKPDLRNQHRNMNQLRGAIPKRRSSIYSFELKKSGVNFHQIRAMQLPVLNE